MSISHEILKGAVPPAAELKILPSSAPKQLTSFVLVTELDKGGGSDTIAIAVSEQLFISVTVTIYVPQQ